MQHELKIFPEYYQEIVTGRKKFEIRQTDRDYKIGDTLYLREFNLKMLPNPINGYYTGRICFVRIDYILFHAPGLELGYCILSITHLKK